MPAGPAVAAPADDCAAPTRTVTGSTSGAPLDVAAGEVVLIAGGTQSGGVNSLPAGATLCVAAGATLAPAYVNNAAGTVYVAPGGTASLPSIATNAGFVLDNAGTTTVAGLNVNGPGTVRNAAGATLAVTGQLAPAAGTVVNDGTLALPGGATVNGNVSLVNNGTLTAGGTTTISGAFRNAGTATLGGDVIVNGGGSLHNLCIIDAAGGLTTNAPGSTNTGLVALGGGLQVSGSGSWSQTPTGATTATTLTDDGAVTGYGRYAFTGTTSVQGTFAGDLALVPIFLDVPGTTFPYFDVVNGTVANVDRRDLTIPGPADYPAPDCADPAAPPSADVQVAKTGPASVLPDGTLTYTVTVTNAGPDAAEDVTVTDTLPPTLLDPAADAGGVVAGGTVTWSLGTLAAGQTVTLTASGRAPADGTLVNVVSATSTTPDPDASNNDGSADSETVTTDVEPSPPDTGPPTAAPLTRDGPPGLPIVGVLDGSSPDPDLQLRYSVVDGPTSGRVIALPNGLFGYLPDDGFVGTDTFTYRVCDNQTPAECSAPATVTLIIHPRAVNDETTTLMDQPVTIDVLANDPGGAVLSSNLDASASHGLTQIDPATGTVTYTPGPGYLGDDTFVYRACAPADPGDCALAVVVVHVVPDNLPPLAPPLAMETTVGAPVTGAPAVSDPDGDAVALASVFPPTTGDATATTTTTTYTPPPGFAGRAVYQYTVCDDGVPVLCATGLVTVLVDPVAGDDSATTPAGTPVTVDVAANDLGTVLPPDVATPPANGTVALAGGALVYTPAPGFVGTDTFTYRICADDVSPACDTATVTVVVTGDGPPVDPGDPGDGGAGGTGGGSGTGAAPGGGGLPVTGADAAPLAALAAALLAAGAAALTARRRATAPARARRPGPRR
ncbi:hypothetical protein CHO01_04850 [Cellulomonas hominis]|uniref:Putative repeat protein (TIGR01451 family) n=1 Tax=Cellulomonas hominis TaxID=156981 RepID=A0A511F7Y0_9CELL|nr:Ig-like domain-containing protein [Cellulomonas hominis]MBB5473202.1 putative repeat protein (TIGR01451 family) [Cellulomonas hominis]GEL45369.1 hypothetical protein CHO01_04850 [Cellulomonas hominis]